MMKLVLLAALVAVAVAASDDYVLFKTRKFLPSNYMRTQPPKGDKWDSTPVTFAVLLKQKNLDKLEDLFWKVSDPTHELYGKFLSAEEIHSMTESPIETREAVLNWIETAYKAYGAKSAEFSVVDRRDALHVTAPVSVVEALFKTTLAPFKRTQGNNRNHLYIKYVDTLSIPRELENVIDLVTGIVEFPPIAQVPHKVQGSYECNTPYSMKRMYSVDLDLEASTQRASQAPYSEIGSKDEGFGAADLEEFQKINGVIEKPITNIIGNDAKGYTDLDTDTEAALDVQCLTGFANGANTSFWVMNDWMYEYANEILNTNDPPLVNSMSYGWYESQQCRIDGDCEELGFGTSEDYVLRTDVEFQKLGVLGITMLAASGDDGTESTRKCTAMRPDYPASSVYVTSVGATAVVADSKYDPPVGSDAPEACTNAKYACNCSTSNLEHAAMKSNNAGFDSGGGFSQWLHRPAYQSSAVIAYLNSGVALPDQQYWNVTGRGYPDVAAVGASLLVISNGKSIRVGGTSASCPIWGGLVTMLNSDRLSSGKSPLGFINPLLYKMYQDQPSSYNDITVGTNGGGCANLAFQATKGWDPLTGLGTPVFSKIRSYIKNLP